ncbi:MAG: hypothetical protein K2P93_05085 [Alphaproteobacteria bacterium]|nr:hypothetical protein [Alphaproteobacteria bacterium]
MKTKQFISILWISILYTLFLNGPSCTLPDDEIDFFNVGQGHAVLINKVGRSPTTAQPYVPLLIDAGSGSRPRIPQEQYVWVDEESSSLVSKMSTKVLAFWKESNNGILLGGNYKLNIIITHVDNDHSGFVPDILRQLEEKRREIPFSFTPFLLLGGEQTHYERSNSRRPSFLSLIRDEYLRAYSVDCAGMHRQGNLGSLLEASGCITHLFCPTGIRSDTNRWSIITRIQISELSAIFTGDANQTVKRQMLFELRGNEDSLLSDILLVPHHGAEDTYHAAWDHAVNPRAIIIGSAPHGGLLANSNNSQSDNTYRHPRGETILNFLRLFEGRGRIWDRVKHHTLQYYCEEPIHEQIQEAFIRQEARLFERVPNTALEIQTEQPQARWHLIWSDIPIYTLWTTGTLIFSRDVKTPQFIDAPNGLMGYVAVSNPEYYLSPDQRPQNVELIYLIRLLLQGGEGNSDIVTNTITSFPLEQIQGSERDGIILTRKLSLYENRANILRTLLEIPLIEREEALTQLESLTQITTQNFSARYRILSSLMRLDQRGQYLNYLREKSFLIPKDALATAIALEVFSRMPFIQAQEIVALLQPRYYRTFENITQREHLNILKIIERLSALESERRISIFEVASRFIMPHQNNDNPHLNFYDVDDNAYLIKLFADVPPSDIPLFEQQVVQAISYLTADNLRYLYGENKHHFIKALCKVSPRELTNFLGGILPLMAKIPELIYESWEAASIAEKLADIYTQANYPMRLQYINMQFSNIPQEQRGEFISETFDLWLQHPIANE